MTAPQPPAEPTPAEVLELALRGYTAPFRLRHDAPVELARLRGIEQRARHMVDNPGRYDEDDVSTARFILGEDTPNA